MQIALQQNNRILSKTIRFCTRGKYSHAAIVFNDGTVIETRPFRNVREYKNLAEANCKGEIIDLFDVDASPSQERIVRKFLRNQIGKKYDYWSVFGFVFHTTEESRKSHGKWFCSELVFASVKKAGITLLQNIPAWEIPPTFLSYSSEIKFDKQIIL